MKTLRAVLILGALCVAMTGCGRLFPPLQLKLSGTLELTEHAVGAKAAGRLTTLLVDEGDEVAQGQLLATLDRFEQAQRDYDRAAQLLQQGGVTQQSVELAALALEDQRVRSPVNGVVLVKVSNPGEVVAAGAPVVVIGDRSRQWVRIFVPEGLINRVQLHQPATLQFDGIARTFTGHVSFIAPKAEFTPRNVQTPEERVTQTFAVKVMLDTPDAAVRPGVAVDVALALQK